MHCLYKKILEKNFRKNLGKMDPLYYNGNIMDITGVMITLYVKINFQKNFRDYWVFIYMNIKIPKDKFENMIITYLDRDVEPDYSWGPELHDFYREDVDRYGSYDFVVNDIPSYSYVENVDGKQLLIQPYLYERLTNLFGELWIPIFKKWFEYNSGLEVDYIFD